MLAMLNAQMLEIVCKLAEPALAAPLWDDDAASRVVNDGLRRKFFDAITALAEQLDGAVELDDQLVEDLHRARRRRNELAHDWLWLMAPRVLAGRADLLIAELEGDAEEFGRLSSSLLESVFADAVAKRGVTLERIRRIADRLGFLFVAAPNRFTEINLKPPSGEEFFERSLDLFDQIDTVGVDEAGLDADVLAELDVDDG
jgi:hypothetical protein